MYVIVAIEKFVSQDGSHIKVYDSWSTFFDYRLKESNGRGFSLENNEIARTEASFKVENGDYRFFEVYTKEIVEKV